MKNINIRSYNCINNKFGFSASAINFDDIIY